VSDTPCLIHFSSNDEATLKLLVAVEWAAVTPYKAWVLVALSGSAFLRAGTSKSLARPLLLSSFFS